MPNQNVPVPSNSRRKFQIGDTVITTQAVFSNGFDTASVGVVRAYNSDRGDYAVDFVDSPSVVVNDLHDCDGAVTSGRGWYIGGRYLEKHTPKPKNTKPLFDTVIISDDKRLQIVEALEQLNQGGLIFDDWGFSETIEKGRGVSMLFYGPPGTGKTLMGSAIAEMLGYQIKVIGTADLQSSTPGQMERNVRDIFEQYSATGTPKTVLLFDECDSLIYDRTVVGAILGAQINQLLQSLEKFDGVTIFTTNRLETLDEAVNRRLALKLEFGMPTADERAKIWARMFPKKCPLAEDVDFNRLAQIEIAGGHIKNAVLRAARIVASDKKSKKKEMRMEHLVRALNEEGKSMIEFDAAKKKWNSPARPAGQTGYSMGFARSM